MPISFMEMVSDTGSVTFQWAGQSVTVEYYPSLVTEETFAAVFAFSNMDPNTFATTFKNLNELLAGKAGDGVTPADPGLIKSWDAYEDEAKTIPMPITAERLKKLPLFFRMRILQSIIDNIRPEAMATQA